MVQSGARRQAELLRRQGNRAYERQRFGAAIDLYTEAITLCPEVPEYYTNRALCHLKRNDWKRVEEDSSRAIELDRDSVKAYYMMGRALLERQDYDGAIKKLRKALDLGRVADPVGYMVEEIWHYFAKANDARWEEESSKRVCRLQELRETCVEALNQHHFLETFDRGAISEEVADAHSERLEHLNQVFDTALKADIPADVPDYLCCKLTLDIFRDPVITPSGVTYERAVIIDHLHNVGKFDPVSRKRLEPDQLVPNLAIKEAVQAFLDEHGWAYKT
ncbi:E3 ubiquitin-protein ligase CHIP [Acorus gramineus]|uniref:E3 ubiquitin-protein ligase CHIP n=1 Tax=Acorus gramineus TaxID=55184 RepID=A0AAV9BHA2_ACOGR|nr:E3 ubiquitin-protein ligase CHIP [Acorus gramineus]